MDNGIIFKALSGFYYVKNGEETVRCRARGRFRHDKTSPLVGDKVSITISGGGEGVIDEILPRKNSFSRPPVANIDLMVLVVSNVIPVTDPFLIDRMSAIAEHKGCEAVICINKCDLDRADDLYNTYARSGFKTLRTSAVTGEGIAQLADILNGKICAFSGNSGVGKSSILNAIDPEFSIQTGDISEKLGRGRHTTRHVELFETLSGAIIADTPGFSSFDVDRMDMTDASQLQYAFHEFIEYIPQCRYTGCSHIKEDGCAVLKALEDGRIAASRHKSYVRLYTQLKSLNNWDK
ncbi:MAG: ribosome small subunit-dependent GTPase A [Oscillospiraceae bacterium]